MVVSVARGHLQHLSYIVILGILDFQSYVPLIALDLPTLQTGIKQRYFAVDTFCTSRHSTTTKSYLVNGSFQTFFFSYVDASLILKSEGAVDRGHTIN